MCYRPMLCFPKRLPLFLATVLGLTLWMSVPQAEASTVSYGYIGFDNHPEADTQPDHQIMVTDGYCMFIDYSGPFNRLCVEAGVGFRFAPSFAFDVHAQLVLHHIWLRPYIYGAFFSIGPMFTAIPEFYGGFRMSAGFHFYFVAPSIEFQQVFDVQGTPITRVLVQLTVPIPTGSINFAMGNVGL